MKPQSLVTAAALALLLAGAPAVSAQQTRQDQIQKQREEKARQLRPYKPGKVEAALIRLEESRLLGRIFAPPNGMFPRISGITPGSGYAIGPGYRANGLAGGQLDILATAALSIKKYWVVEGSVALPRLARNRLFAEFHGRRYEFPQEDFFGPSRDSSPGTRTNFALWNTAFGGSGGVRLVPGVAVGERVEYLSPAIGSGRDTSLPSTEDLFTDAEAPGLSVQPDFLRYETFLDIDYRRPGPNAKRGGRYLVSFSKYSDRDLDRFSFDRWDIDLQQFLPLFHGERVFALRLLAALSDSDPGHEVPFYLQPWLGGSHMLRSVRSLRYRDRNVLLLQAEYRFDVLPILGGALFYDIGDVAAERGDLSLKKARDDYGFGLRFGVPAGVFLRTDVAFGGPEGTRFLLRFSNVF